MDETPIKEVARLIEGETGAIVFSQAGEIYMMVPKDMGGDVPRHILAMTEMFMRIHDTMESVEDLATAFLKRAAQ